uniref:Beta-1,4-galactosyltransferase n=1 Tax=Petromyzon marinus TaxID=7757 RepID=S4RP30_PETMA
NMSLGRALELASKLVVALCALHFFIMLALYLDVHTHTMHALRRAGVANVPAAGAAVWAPRSGGGRETLASNGSVGAAFSEGAAGPMGPGKTPLEPCPDSPKGLLGPLKVDFTKTPTLEEVQKSNPNVELGGRFRPKDCLSSQKVAIIIPFRHRDEHLKHWLYYLHPVLQRQRVEYGVYVLNQFGEGMFNRAKLMNIGYVEALKDAPYDCFIFSDVDLVPMDDRNLYRCYDNPRHFSVAMDKFSFRLPYNSYFGGVSGLSKAQYLKINGFPNEYWGWGGEDDDIYNRVVVQGMRLSRPDGSLGRYRMVKHARDAKNEPNPKRFTQIKNTRHNMGRDGINTLKYRHVETVRQPLYTNVTVDVGKMPARHVA